MQYADILGADAAAQAIQKNSNLLTSPAANDRKAQKTLVDFLGADGAATFLGADRHAAWVAQKSWSQDSQNSRCNQRSVGRLRTILLKKNPRLFMASATYVERNYATLSFVFDQEHISNGVYVRPGLLYDRLIGQGSNQNW